MTDEKPPTKDNSVRDMAVRTQALDWAIRANVGLCYDAEGRQSYSEDEIIKAASKFDSFIRNGSISNPEPFIEGVSNHPNNPESKFKKDDWK